MKGGHRENGAATVPTYLSIYNARCSSRLRSNNSGTRKTRPFTSPGPRTNSATALSQQPAAVPWPPPPRPPSSCSHRPSPPLRSPASAPPSHALPHAGRPCARGGRPRSSRPRSSQSTSRPWPRPGSHRFSRSAWATASTSTASSLTSRSSSEASASPMTAAATRTPTVRAGQGCPSRLMLVLRRPSHSSRRLRD
jgi:hypothetical protein